MERGELKRRAFERNLLTNLILSADSSEYKDVHIITSKQWLADQAYEEAWNGSYFPGEVDEYAEHLLKTKYHSTQEFVHVTLDGIYICIDVDRINDSAMDYAISLLSRVNNISPGTKVYFEPQYDPYHKKN